jgi:phosphoserine aminotransferase
MTIHNFSSGPAILPKVVMQQAAEGCLDLDHSGLSILEISHRGKAFTAIIEETEALLRELIGISEEYAVLFLSGGASSQFFMAPMNLLNENETACYIDTGVWSAKAIKEAKLFGKVDVIASSKSANYTFIPKDVPIPTDGKYLHITSNNTIYGTQYKSFPNSPIPIVCDMSSDILSYPIAIEQFGLIYAGAQKNMGPAGMTLVIVRKDLLGTVNRAIPSMLDYRIHIENGSLYNTGPVFPIYVTMLTLRWLKAEGGTPIMYHRNKAKAELIYKAIDENPLFECPNALEDRSVMNAVFVAKDTAHEKPFMEACRTAGCDGVKGHRSVGGFRASMYNAMDINSVKVLADVMHDFALKYG